MESDGSPQTFSERVPGHRTSYREGAAAVLGVLTPSQLAVCVNLHNQIKSNSEKETKQAKQANQKTKKHRIYYNCVKIHPYIGTSVQRYTRTYTEI